MFQNVVFDLDGTLLDTLQDLAAAGNYALSAMELPRHPVDNFKFMVGNGIPKLVERMLPETNRGAATRELAFQLFSKYYNQHLTDLTVPYPGIVKMLENLKNNHICMSVASNKADAFVCQLVEEIFPHTFAAVAGLREGLPPKPNPAIVLALTEQLGATPQNTLYVGDSDVDMQTAQNAGVASCGVLWGFRPKEELAAHGAVYLAESTEQLERLILMGSL